MKRDGARPTKGYVSPSASALDLPPGKNKARIQI